MDCKIAQKFALGLIASGSIVLGTSSLSADEKIDPPDAARGKGIAKRLCVNCHVISEDSTATVPDGVPTFKGIANRRQQTASHIRSILIEPHPPMPNMHLTRAEIEDIIALLNELRDEASGPPLMPKRQDYGPKPVYPEPS